MKIYTYTYTRVLLYMVPLALLFVTIVILGPNTSYWGVTNYPYYIWLWRSSSVPLSTSSRTANNVPTNTNASLTTFLEKNVNGDFQLYGSVDKGASLLSPPVDVKQVKEMKGLSNNSSSDYVQKRYSNLERVEFGLGHARAAIRMGNTNTSVEIKPQDYDDYVPNGPMYWNATAFHRSYMEMEKKFKVFVYEEGEPPIFHYGPCKSTYAIEGIFIQSMEISRFRTYNPENAHVFFIPLSVTMLTQVVYVENSHEWTAMKNAAKDYVDVIANKHRFWNRSLGADHFMVACHDWGPEISFAVPNLYNNSIRALCNANTSEKFDPSRDVSIPEIHLPRGTSDGLLGGPSPSKRPILVFYAGGVHGPIRPILLAHWENKDSNVQVHKYLPKGVSYYDMMKKSKYCICPSGYEVASPRMVEAIYLGCVPVLIKDNYVIPFSDVLNWRAFSIILPVEDIPNLKEILVRISSRQYIRMQRRGKQVRKHFEVNSPPKRYDVFHMILHSIWLRRLNVRVRDTE